MYIQDISLPSGIDRTKKGINGMQDYSNKSSVKSSHSGNRQWQEETTRQADDDEMGESSKENYLHFYWGI